MPLPDPYWIGAQQTAAMVNLWSKSKARIEDFIPRAQPQPKRLTPEQSAGLLKRLVKHG